MVISHKNKYLFVALPRTGTNAIANELIENYSGESILYKHAVYKDFEKEYPDIAGKYFVFSCLRNPLDRVASFYMKISSGYYDWKLERDIKKTLYFKHYLLPKIKYVKQHSPSFEEFFLKYYKFPYSDWAVLDHKKFDFLMRFENLNHDFKTALLKLGLKAVRDLPVVNKTVEKSKSFEEFYNTESIINRAVHVFGPYMKEFDYDFPENFKGYRVSNSSEFLYNVSNLFKKIYWLHIKSVNR